MEEKSSVDEILPAVVTSTTIQAKKRSILKNGSQASSEVSVKDNIVNQKKRVHFGVTFINNFPGIVSFLRVNNQKLVWRLPLVFNFEIGC